MKLITILDCYIHDDSILNKLENFIDNLKSKNKTILLISNSTVPTNIQNKIDYFFYDHNNPMFSEDWKFLNGYYISSGMENFTIEDVYPQLQPHGLSVMINLYRGIRIAKELGFTHFEKMEYDPLFDEESFNNFASLPNLCIESNKNSLFFINNKTVPIDLSFHYFFSDIDLFLNNTKVIDSESDYRESIIKKYNDNIFIGVERFLYDSIENVDKSLIYFVDEETRDSMFKNVYWNSEISRNNLPKKYKNCGSRIYKVLNSDGEPNNDYLIVLSHSFSDDIINRRIDCHFDDGVIYTVNHTLGCKGNYNLTPITPNLVYIDVYENDELIYTEHIIDCKNTLMYK